MEQLRRRIHAGPRIEVIATMISLEEAETDFLVVSSFQCKTQRWRYGTPPICTRMSEGIIDQESERPTHLRSRLIHLDISRTKLHIAQFLYAAISWAFGTFVF